jgi:hypothetical protein
MKEDIKFIVLILAILLIAIVVGPLAIIWSMNTLFPVLAIPYDISTWAAVIILAGVFKTTVNYKK